MAFIRQWLSTEVWNDYAKECLYFHLFLTSNAMIHAFPETGSIRDFCCMNIRIILPSDRATREFLYIRVWFSMSTNPSSIWQATEVCQIWSNSGAIVQGEWMTVQFEYDSSSNSILLRKNGQIIAGPTSCTAVPNDRYMEPVLHTLYNLMLRRTVTGEGRSVWSGSKT